MMDPSAATTTPPTGPLVVTATAPSWLALEPEPVSARKARGFTRRLLARDDPGLVDDVVTVVAELVNNAIVHAPAGLTIASGISPLIHLSLQWCHRWALVGVRDPWPDIPRKRPATGLGVDGRGLHLVDELAASRWTHTREHDKTVYALILRHGAALADGELERLHRQPRVQTDPGDGADCAPAETEMCGPDYCNPHLR